MQARNFRCDAVGRKRLRVATQAIVSKMHVVLAAVLAAAALHRTELVSWANCWSPSSTVVPRAVTITRYSSSLRRRKPGAVWTCVYCDMVQTGTRKAHADLRSM